MKIVKVVKNINRGGFGIIDEVICEDGKHYARKQFSPSDQFKIDKNLCDRLKIRFIREVKTQKILPDDYFMPILFDDLNDTNPYFIMPLAESVYSNEIELCKRIKRHPKGLGDILNGLEFLHDKGLVHRDLKPQNILKHNGIWKLADFGLISQDKEILSQTITTSKNAYGTALYCAPEQVVEFNRITPQADIYSFGAILHDIFTDGNRVPYSELSGLGEIGQIIEKCTKYKKEQRFRNVKSIRIKLLSFLSDKNEKATKVSDEEWQNKFLNITNWDEDNLENFIFYLKANHSIKTLTFHNITEEILQSIYNINKDQANEFFIIYLDWLRDTSFNFDYADVLIGNVYYIYQTTRDIEVKSKCALSGAELGSSHNRWYVMRYIVRMSNPEIDDNLAFRIAMEIELDPRSKNNFINCVRQIKLTISSYHNKVKDVLKVNTN